MHCALAQKILFLNDDHMKKLSKNSHEFAAKYFNVENAVTNLIRELEL